jgi:hypothetical protein
MVSTLLTRSNRFSIFADIGKCPKLQKLKSVIKDRGETEPREKIWSKKSHVTVSLSAKSYITLKDSCGISAGIKYMN